MALAIRFEDGVNCPYVICDGCGECITDGHGNVIWQRDEREEVTRGPLFLHKVCPDGKHRDNEDYLCEELDRWLVYLLGNAGIDFPKAERRVFFLDRRGRANYRRHRSRNHAKKA